MPLNDVQKKELKEIVYSNLDGIVNNLMDSDQFKNQLSHNDITKLQSDTECVGRSVVEAFQNSLDESID